MSALKTASIVGVFQLGDHLVILLLNDVSVLSAQVDRLVIVASLYQ